MGNNTYLKRGGDNSHPHSRLGSALTDCALLLGLAAIASMVLLLSVVLLARWVLGSVLTGFRHSARAVKAPALRQTFSRLPARWQTLRRQ